MPALPHLFRAVLPTLFFLAQGFGYPAFSDTARVAVASNFASAARQLAKTFDTTTGHHVAIVTGSTGKLYAQIRNGAPFDAFLSADRLRPELLEKQGAAVAGSRFTYALGRLALWSPGWFDASGGEAILRAGRFRHLAIANPKLAPYGKAAQEALTGMGLWQTLQGRMVRGENIGQALQFVNSGNAELGFVAWSQITRSGGGAAGSFWLVPASLHAPIVQQAVLLSRNVAASGFLDYLKTEAAKQIIRDAGYDTP